MNKLLIIIMVAFTTVGCSTYENEYDSIDFMAYSYPAVKSDNPLSNEGYRLFCRYYVLIDDQSSVDLVILKTSPIHRTSFHEMTYDKKTLGPIIKRIIEASDSVPDEIDLRYLKSSIYDGPYLLIRINKKNSSKTIHFRLNESESKVYEKLYSFIDSVSETSMLEVLKDTTEISKKRQEFIDTCWKYDSLWTPHTRGVIKWVAPTSVDTL